jgi:glycosyltransferase involved in cell wall biosynthesis
LYQTNTYWIITLEYPPAYGGGIGTYCYETAHMLRERGWTITIFIPSRSGASTSVKHVDGIRIVEFGIEGKNSLEYLGYDTALAYEFSQVIEEYIKREGRPEVLESQEYGGIAYYILQKKHLGYPYFAELKVLLTLHAPSFLYHHYNRAPVYQLPYYWIAEMERWCIHAADAVIAPSKFITEAIKPYFPKNWNRSIDIIPNPFRVSARNSIQGNADPKKNWFFFGKLTAQKGVFELLKATAQMWQKRWNHELTMIGGGAHFYYPENTSVENFLKKKYGAEIKSGRLRLLGSMPAEKWKQKFGQQGIVIIPSIVDNYPYTVLEAMAMGQVVLASVQGGQRELIVHGENGFLFDHEKEGDLEEKMQQIARMPAESLLEIGKRAMATVSFIHEYQRIYELKLKTIESLRIQASDRANFPFLRNINTNFFAESQQTKGQDLLSVVIPYYNMGEYVEETVISVLESTYSNKEIIVVDDGSNKRASIDKLEEIQGKYGVTVIRQSNKGLPEARNAGARAAKGKYLAFLDPDDKVHPEYYTRAINILESKANVFFVGCWAQYFGNSKNKWPAFQPEPPYLLYHNMVCSSALVYKKSGFEKYGWNDPRLEYGFEDWESVVSMVKNGMHGIVIPEPWFYYRVRKGSMVRKFNQGRILFSYRYIAEKHSDIYSDYASELVNLLNTNGPGYSIDNPSLDYHHFGILPKKLRVLKKLVRKAKKIPVLRKLILKTYSIIKK